jgi:hypothetical protein
MPVTTQGADLAAGILTQLGENFDLPTVDLTTAIYTLPTQTDNTLYTDVAKIEVADLTTGVEGGEGAFDKIMASNKAHILGEYEANRITGDQYAKAYIELTTSALSAGMQMVLGRDQAYWQAHIAQAQGRKAEIEVVTASVQLAAAKAQLATLHYQAQEAETRAVLTKMQLATEDATYRLANEQYIQAAFTTTNIQPLQKEITTEERDQAQYTGANILPLQKDQLDQQIAQLTYTVGSLLPAQKGLVDEQREAKHGETMDTRTDGTTAIVGMVGKQKDLYSQQIDSYKKDAEYKVGKLFSDSWITRMTIDEATLAPDQYDTAEVNGVLSALRTSVNLD